MLLAFDTTLDICSVALLNGAGEVTTHIRRQMNRGHAEALVPMIAEAMEAAGAGMGAVERVAVTTGPGTFTGVRVGVSAARGLALAQRLPVAGITTLEMLAGGAFFSGEYSEGTKILAAIDARRDQAYVALYQIDGPGGGFPLRCLAEPAAIELGEIAAWLDGISEPSGEIITVGSAAEILAGPIKKLHAVDTQADAAVVARLAAALPEARWAEKPRALYLRPPDARLPGIPAAAR